MKIGIVTTYDEVNFGAYLQAYCLYNILAKYGDVKFINYKSKIYRWAEFKATFFIKNPFYLIKVVFKYLKFKQDLKHLSVTKKINHIQDIDALEYDLIFFGSDEIWNVQNCLGGVIDTYYFGKNINAKKISYAASFGSTTSIDRKFKSLLENFEYISVRDQNSKSLLENENLKNIKLVLDPTFLFDPNPKKIKKMDPYIMYYCVNHNIDVDNELSEFALKNNLKIYSIGYKSKCFKNIISVSPLEWVSFISNSLYVVTDMFHGTIFSIKYKKQFVTIFSEYRKNKLGHLISNFNLENQVYEKGKLEEKLNQKIDYIQIHNKIKKQKIYSLEFINNSIKNHV